MRLEVTYATGIKKIFTDVLNYRPIEGPTMNFTEAAKVLKDGGKVRRLSWDEGNHLVMTHPTVILNVHEQCPEENADYVLTIPDFEADDWWIVVD